MAIIPKRTIRIIQIELKRKLSFEKVSEFGRPSFITCVDIYLNIDSAIKTAAYKKAEHGTAAIYLSHFVSSFKCI